MLTVLQEFATNWSPSTRREWIEISDFADNSATAWSPSTRREWIEITTRHLPR